MIMTVLNTRRGQVTWSHIEIWCIKNSHRLFFGKYIWKKIFTRYKNFALQRVLQKRKRLIYDLNPLGANPTNWSNTLKQFVGKLATNCLSVFDHFVGLVLKGLRKGKQKTQGKHLRSGERNESYMKTV